MRRKFLPQLSEFERLGLVFLPVVKILKTLQKSLPLPDSHFHFVFSTFRRLGRKKVDQQVVKRRGFTRKYVESDTILSSLKFG